MAKQRKTRISKFIEIDMGHRVTNHDSKCANMHGHRYRIEVQVEGPLIDEGSSEGMVVDYSRLKDMLMDVIDAKYDHGCVLWCRDILVCTLSRFHYVEEDERENPGHEAYVAHNKNTFGKLVVSTVVPTAENLAAIWLGELQAHQSSYLPDSVKIRRIRVYETPTSVAELRG